MEGLSALIALMEFVGGRVEKVSEDSVRKKEMEVEGDVKMAKINGITTIGTAVTAVGGTAMITKMILNHMENNKNTKK